MSERIKIGYARVSTVSQNLDMQIDALQKVGCRIIYEEKESSVKERPELKACLEIAKKTDNATLVVWKLDRLSRSLKELMKLMEELNENDIMFESIQDSINTSSPVGKLFFHMIGAFAEFERDLISERTKVGLKAALARGRKGGRKQGLSDSSIGKAYKAHKLYNLPEDKRPSIKEILKECKIGSPSTLYKYLDYVESETSIKIGASQGKSVITNKELKPITK